MTIVDAQIHLTARGTPSAHHRKEPYSKEQALELRAFGLTEARDMSTPSSRWSDP
jgi:hypothetical protein